jgi:hypothetical protein
VSLGARNVMGNSKNKNAAHKAAQAEGLNQIFSHRWRRPPG